MKLASKQLLLAAAMLGLSAAASASSYAIHGNQYAGTSFDVTGIESGQAYQTVDYTGNTGHGGLETWNVNLTRPEALTIDITTAQDSSAHVYGDVASAAAVLRNITKVELWDSTQSLGGAAATLDLQNSGRTLASTVSFSISKLLSPGTYYLKIFGDANTAYSGTISAVPLPGAALLFGSALMGIGALRRKQADKTAA